MTIDRWLAAAVADAQTRRLPALIPLLEGLAGALQALRGANFAGDASGGRDRASARPHTS